MAGTYISLIGVDNVVSLVDTAPAAILRGTVNGVEVDGRPGQVKTSLLVALDGAATPDVPATTAAALFTLVVACPPGFATPASAGENGFDYSALLPEVTAECIAENFNVVAAAWPVTMTALLAEMVEFPPNLTSVVGRLTAMAAPSTANPYGTLTYVFTGAATTASVSDALVRVTVDFGASLSN